jgi:hypothetical protein
MFDAVGMPVQRLVRVRVGTLKLTDLRVGEARRLTHGEVSLLASCARAQTTTRPQRPVVRLGEKPAEAASRERRGGAAAE